MEEEELTQEAEEFDFIKKSPFIAKSIRRMTEAEVYEKYPNLAPTPEEAENEHFLANLDLESEKGIKKAAQKFEEFFKVDPV